MCKTTVYRQRVRAKSVLQLLKRHEFTIFNWHPLLGMLGKKPFVLLPGISCIPGSWIQYKWEVTILLLKHSRTTECACQRNTKLYHPNCLYSLSTYLIGDRSRQTGTSWDIYPKLGYIHYGYDFLEIHYWTEKEKGRWFSSKTKKRERHMKRLLVVPLIGEV